MKINKKAFAKVYSRAAELVDEGEQTINQFSCIKIKHAAREMGRDWIDIYPPERIFYGLVFDISDRYNYGANSFEGFNNRTPKLMVEGNNHRVIALLTLAAALEAGADFGI